MNARELAALMAENAQQVVEHLLPNGRKSGKEWKTGSVAGEKGNSLSVCLSGAKRGVWKDFDSGEAGDLLDLWCSCRTLSVADAMRDAKQFLGVRDDMPKRQAPTYQRPERPKARRATSVLEQWFAGRGLTMDTVNAFKVVEQPRGDALHVVFPYFRGGELINAKYRNIADKKDMRQEAGAEPCLFGWHLIEPSCRVVAIAEGEIDAMTLHQNGIPALSVNAGAGNHQWIDNDWEHLERFSEILLCYDNDDAGRKGVREVANRLGLERCRVVIFGESKDANEYLESGATPADFKRCCTNARGLDPEELRSLADYWADVKASFWPAHEEAAHDPWLQFCGVSQLWFEFRPGEVTVWTGYNGHGKSLLIGQALIGLMMQGERACIFSGEMKPKDQGRRYAKQLGGLDRPSLAYLDHMEAWVRDRIWLFDLVGTASIDRLIAVFTYAFKRYGIRHFVVDSLMMTDVPEDGPGAMTAQKDAMRKLAALARSLNVHVHLVAHPRKGANESRSPGKMDVSGSSKITDAADNVFSVWSAQKEEIVPGDEEPDCWLELHKQRNGDTQHKKLPLFFNLAAQQYSTRYDRRPYIHIPFNVTEQQEQAA